MKLELSEIYREMITYLTSAWVAVHPILKVALSAIMYVLFPTETYMTYAQILGLMVVFDLASKYYAISVKNNGFRNALRTGRLSSHSMWVGTRKKIVSYLVVMILVGLAYRFEFFQTPVEFIGTIAYSVMFWREGQSVVENFIEAGHRDLKWLLFILKSKEKEALSKVSGDNSKIAKKPEHKTKQSEEKNDEKGSA